MRVSQRATASTLGADAVDAFYVILAGRLAPSGEERVSMARKLEETLRA
ncbi:hypothetical protein GCM10023238_04200 [Streptomyces heliomycini]